MIVGGRSSEHSISCISGRSIVQALDPRRYAVSVVGIRRDGQWVRSERGPEGDAGLDILTEAVGMPEVSWDSPMAPVVDCLDVDVVFPVLHGPWGEDGTLQGLLETLGVPYVGSGVLASALAMDKGFMKDCLASAGLDVGRYVVVTDRQWRADAQSALAAVEGLGLPVFVKPARAGSSLGISKVTSASGIVAAIEAARAHDPRVIVEAGVPGAREIECGVLVSSEDVPSASRCAEIIVDDRHEFYDFEAKYVDGSTTLVVPADLEPAVEAEVQRLAICAFDALGCEGLARVDFFLSREGRIVVNEANTMPGFTPISMFPRMWQASGIDYRTLVDRLVSDALRKGTGLR